MIRRIYTVLGALAVALVMAIGLAPAAHASSTICAMYGDGIRWGVRNGQFCATVNGRGTYIDSVTSNFGVTIPGRNVVCNPSVKVDIYNRYGQWLAWRQGTQGSGCQWGTWNGTPKLFVNADFPGAVGGYALVTLQSYGSPVASTQHRLG